MDDALREFNQAYNDLRILHEFMVEYKTKINNITSETSIQEVENLYEQITCVYVLTEEKMNLLKDSQVATMLYFEKQGISKDSKVEEMQKIENTISRYIYTDNQGNERYYESVVLDRNKYDEIKLKIHELEHASKKLQPAISDSQKPFKKNVLRASGFVESSNGKLIHPSIIEQYEELLKLKYGLDNKYKNAYTLKDKYEEILQSVGEIDKESLLSNLEKLRAKNNEKTLEPSNDVDEAVESYDSFDSIQDLETKIKDLLKNTSGKKMFVKFCGKQYYVAKKDAGKLTSLLSDLRRRKIEAIDDTYLEHIKDELKNNNGFVDSQVNIITLEVLKQLIYKNPDKDLLNLLSDFIKTNYVENPIVDQSIDENNQKSDSESDEDKQKNNPGSDEDKQKNDSGSDEDKQKNDSGSDKDKQKNDSGSDKDTINENVEPDGKKRKFSITNIRKYTKEHSKKIIALIAAGLIVSSTFFAISKYFKKQKGNVNNTPEIITEIDENNEPGPNDVIEDNNDDYNFMIGSTVTISPSSNIYKSTYDAKDNTNPVNPYFNYSDERVILGVTVNLNGVDYNVYAYNENANKYIENMLSLGGKVVRMAVGNKSKISELKNYTGEQISYNNYMSLVEGWYDSSNVEKVEKGHVR